MISDVGEKLFTSCVFTYEPLQPLSNIPAIVPTMDQVSTSTFFFSDTASRQPITIIDLLYCDPLDMETNGAKNLSHTLGTF